MPDSWPDPGDLLRDQGLTTKMAPSLEPHYGIENNNSFNFNFRGRHTGDWHLARPGGEVALCKVKVAGPMDGNSAQRPLCRSCEFELIKLLIERCHP